MPELPEVETIKRGLITHLQNSIVQGVIVRHSHLRWPIPPNLNDRLSFKIIHQVSRRGKYLLLHFSSGTLIIHLGMSGSLRILEQNTPPLRHDHVDIILPQDKCLRYNDPRRFGAILWTEADPQVHPLIQSIGLEPLDSQFTGEYLHRVAINRRLPIKTFLMNSRIIAGIGNIYANEALFLSKIHPTTLAKQLSQAQCETLVQSIKEVLNNAILSGGTTLKDFVNSEGKPGYFSQQLYVYGRANQPCKICSSLLQLIQLGQRSTVFCMSCQAC
jgi:formamidopyrimidine-DNA glycosylase